MTVQTDPRYAVIIPHFNDVTRLVRMLDALAPQDRSDVEVVVADNGSSADLDPVRHRFPWVRIVTEPQSGAGPARNRGVIDTTAPWLFFIDADCRPAPDWLDQARRIAAGDGDTITGGRVDVFDETPPPRSGSEAFEVVFAFKMQRYLENEGFLGAGNLVVSRAIFVRVGGFRTAVSEDKEWSQRAAAMGIRLAYDDKLAVSHPTRSDWPALARKWRRLTAEEFGLVAPGPAARMRWIGKALAMPASILAHMPRILAHPDLSGREKARAVAVLARLRFVRMVWMLQQAVLGL